VVCPRGGESRLIRWAKGVYAAAIRHRADLSARQQIQDAREADRARTLSWWFFKENSRFGLWAELPA